LWEQPWQGDLNNTRAHIEACGTDAQWLGRQVRALVDKHWPAIERVAAAMRPGAAPRFYAEGWAKLREAEFGPA
jgi:hypothetical protein